MGEKRVAGGIPLKPMQTGLDALTEEVPVQGCSAGALIPVAGIGASAGGLEVFKLLLTHLPADTGLAIVFVHHLDARYRSLLAEILARVTAMPVSEAADGMVVEANHVYVMPAHADLTIAHGALRLAPRTQSPGLHMPIDRFLRSLAEECGSRAIGVILSGTGSDGSAGVEAIKAAGGVTFAQDQGTAKFTTMPKAAQATGCVDFVLPPKRIAAELARMGRHPYIAEAVRTQQERAPAGDEERFGAILAILHETTGIDFSLYREKMIRRRILRRLALHNIDGLAEYSQRLENDSDERMALEQDLLIGVTSFFRDPGSFQGLKELVFPRILRGRPATAPIRVWVAGCATGEEAFSIAILLQEYLDETGAAFPVQIFASDISLAAIEKARGGRYRENIAADITQDRLNRYFTKVEGGYQIHKNLREMCVFTRHNLIGDPPFSKLDLISCRNVLIYLGTVQKDIIPMFHYALKPTGVLFLGASERAVSGDLFSQMDREHGIYAKRETARKPHLLPAGARARWGAAVGAGAAAGPAGDGWDDANVRKQVDRILLSKYSPAGVLVDEDLNVLEIRGQASPYLTLPAGKASFNLVKLIADTGLFLEVEKLIHQARLSGEPTRQERIPYERDGGAGELNVEVTPLGAGQKPSILVLFEPVQGTAVRQTQSPGAPSQGDTRDRQISRLKQQLADARQRFLVEMEEHRTSEDESQDLTEEALSANEELQSLNEELETVKEELQSTNEELITVNDELQAKNATLAEARDYAVTERRLAQNALYKSEEHLRQSQKMEVVGRLAGGIAHDFNNLLTAIIGYSALLVDSLAGNEPAIQHVLEIKTAGDRAASLTQQLLAFSRRQVLQPKVLDLNIIVADFDRMLRRLVGERIKLAICCAPALWQVRADPGEIGRTIMNLSLNARDAMPDGGTLTIETANLTLTETDAPGQGLAPGRYVMMAVRDTGVGMDAEMQTHIFEPFFTTKETGKGTGLGLSTVLGIIEQSGGAIRCESELGRGTTFRIFLPAVAEAVDTGTWPAGGLPMAPRGSETILLVEDEDVVRVLARMVLGASGYTVLEARNGREGLAMCETHQGPIHLLVTDVVMPQLDGRELAEGALKLRPGLKVIFMSGHTQDVTLKKGVEKGVAFLQKPFTPSELAHQVRQALDSDARAAAQP